MKLFQDRDDAGRQIGAALAEMDFRDPLLLGLPRGGVPIAREAARRIGAPWNTWIVRKIASAENPEFALGALAERGDPLLNEQAPDPSPSDIERAREELRSYRERFRSGSPAPEVGNRTVVIVDDGLATGLSARAAARAVRAGGARRVVGVFPVAPPGAQLGDDFDEVHYLFQPQGFQYVADFYKNFLPLGDEEVRRDLEEI